MEQWWFFCWELGGCGTHGLLGLCSFLSAPDRFDCLVPDAAYGIFSMPKVAWQEGCASCSAFCSVSPAGQGDLARAGGTLGVWREAWRLRAHLGAWSSAHVISVPYLFHGACPR